ncbi:MAG: hemopexin repeat-containing protein [Cyanobacteria bacterium P01_F01_bin.86]
MQTNLPDYAGLFGNIDFEEGDSTRSVYSPAAYLSDLLQMLDDEFDPNSIDLDTRRSDIKNIELDAENTNTLIPYLDIVNEVLEGRVSATQEETYIALEKAVYPFNMPFSLANEKLKNHRHHLGISAHELRRLFATTVDYNTVAREYLGLSVVELAALIETDAVTEVSVQQAYGYAGSDFTGDLSTVARFMEATDLEAAEMRELLYQQLYVEPTNHAIVEAGREYFYINTGVGSTGYVTLSIDETQLEWQDRNGARNSHIPIAWFDRASRFVRLAKKISLGFTELDHILRHCCAVDGIPTLNAETLVYLAQVVYIHKTLEQPIDTVVAILSEITFMGRSNETLPQDQFNRIFNLPCVAVNEKYLHIPEVMGTVPEQYADTTYHTYTLIDYYADLFSDENDRYRQRLHHTLGFTETDLINITERLEFEEVATSSLWEDPANQWQLLNVLYRVQALATALDVHFLELFTLFDLLEQDPFVGRRDPQTYFVYQAPSTQKCFDIFMAGINGEASSPAISDRAIIYQHGQYSGASQALQPGRYNIATLEAINDNVLSSVKVPDGWRVTLYEDPDFQGRSKTLTADTPWVGDDFNDIASSLVVTGPTSQMSDQLWLFESLIALTTWMQEFGYSAEMLWQIVNGAPQTDQQADEQAAQDLALYNTLLENFKASEMRPDTLTATLGDERASHFAFSLIKGRCGYPSDRAKPSHHFLMAYEPRATHELTTTFIQQLSTIQDYEFSHLRLESKLQAKIISNLVNLQVIDGSGKILTASLRDRQLPLLADFMLEYDFSELQASIFDLFYQVYQEDAAGRLDASDTIEVQVFKSDLEELGLTEAEARQLYDDLIYNGYIDEQGFAQDVELFSDTSGASNFILTTGLANLARPVYDLLQQQLDKFEASRVQISEQLFADLDLPAHELPELIRNLQMNRYLDEHRFIQDKLRLVDESPKTMNLALQFYPHREAIFAVLKTAIATDQDTWLKLDQTKLGKIAAAAVSRWIIADLQGTYLQGQQLLPSAATFFKTEANRDSFRLRPYFAVTQAATVFDHLASIVTYADTYRLPDDKLTALDFDVSEIDGLKASLTHIGVLDQRGLLPGDRVPFFLVPENAAAFYIPGFNDYSTEIFFLLYEVAKAIDGTVKAVNQALEAHSKAQQDAILAQLQNVLGIELEAVKAVSAAVFKTDNNLHFAWLQPLLEEANALGRLDELPDNMHYTQAVKRIRQLALLINKQQLDINEVKLVLEDQDLVAKFPEDLILPDDVTAIDTLLATEEFIYLFQDDYYWIYRAEDYTLIDKKEVVAGIEEDDDLIDRQKEDEEQQKRLQEDPIRQLFEQRSISRVDAAFIDRNSTWVIVSDAFHYVRYADTDVWDQRHNHFGQVDNDFDNLEMVDAAYVDEEGRLFLFANEQYVRYSNINFVLAPEQQTEATQPTIDPGYPKTIATDWNEENLPLQLPPSFNRDLGPLFDGLDDYSYAFVEDRYISSEDGQVRRVADQWGHSEYDFGHANHIDAALASQGQYRLFLNDKVVKYAGSLELANLQPETGYPKALYQEFPTLPEEFVAGIDAALQGLDDRIYLFRDDDFVAIDPATDATAITETRTVWGLVANAIASTGQVDAAFVGLDGYTYLFSGSQYVRYSGSNYAEVDDGFPRAIAEDWEGLTRVTGAFVLGDKTYLFGTNGEDDRVYVRYSNLHEDEDDYLEVDEEDPNARVIATVLANRPDVDEIEVFPAAVNDDFWSLPESLTGGATDFQIDAVMNGPEGKVYLFYGDYYVEHDHASRWWSEPKVLAEQYDRPVTGLEEGDRIVAAFTGTDGKTYLFYGSKYLRFSDPDLHHLDNGYPRLTSRFWGKVRNNIDKTGKVDAALVVESRWEEQDETGQLVDRVAMHTYLFAGDQMFRYEGSDYSTVEPGYPRSISRLKEEPRFRDLPVTFAYGLDAAFADQRQVYLFSGNSFHVVIGDEENYKQYTDAGFAQIHAATQERGVNYVLREGTWQKLNHLEDRTLAATPAIPRAAQKAEGHLEDPISAVLGGTDGKTYVFAGNQYYDVDLERSFAIADVWGRSRNPIYDQETIDAAFVGRDGITYVFAGEWFVQYDSDTYVGQTVTYPPRRISDKWRGLRNVALAYVWEEDTYLFERPDASGTFRYLRYTRDNYDRPTAGYPQVGDASLWQIPTTYQQAGFATIDAIFVQHDTLIFISDQQFISFNLNTENWGHPQPLELLYSGIPFNYTDFQDLKSGFVGADGTAYFFSQQNYVSYDPRTATWSAVTPIKDDWGQQTNVLSRGVDAAWVSDAGITYLFAGDAYVRYSDRDYRYIDEAYPKAVATYLRDEPAFAFMTKEFQQHLDALETAYAAAEEPFAFFNGVLDNGRCLYFFTRDTLFTGSPNKYAVYDIDGLGHVDNNFTAGGYVDAAFVDIENEQTYLFSGEQYIRYSGDRYRYIDPGYPKLIGESLAADLGLNHLAEIYRDGIDAALYLSSLGLVLFNEQTYLNVTRTGEASSSTTGDVNAVWGHLDTVFTAANGQTIDGAYVDEEGALYIFKGSQLVRYSDTSDLFALNPYDEARYVDAAYPRDIDEIWPQLDATILTTNGVDTVFKFEDEIHFHTSGNFVTYNLDRSDQDELKAVQVLAYRWGEWSDYLLSDIHAISRFKDLGQRFTGGELTLTEWVSGAKGTVLEPYMHFAAIFGFEKEAVRWVKQRHAFLPEQVNVIEEDFHLELVLRLYDILATALRLRVDVSALYTDVWFPLYGNDTSDVATAATGAYDLLVAIDCNDNYATLVRQITDELNILKRDALVPYVIANDSDVTTTRQLYQKLLIDIQMASCADTSRIKEATAAVQLYLHRYFLNLEAANLAVSDQQAARLALKDRWQWLRSYRVWEANRKVFLYPENYIRPELRDTKTAGFQALEESLSQGELTETTVEEAYFKYLDTFTEVSELTIAGGYVYDDTSAGNNDKKLVLFGRTRTDPMRYFYRFGTFVEGDSAAATWEPWEELNITIEATRVEPVFAFNRVFVFWVVLEESSEDPSSAIVTTTDTNGGQEVSSSSNSQKEVQVYYSFYNLNKRWTQPQALQTTFNNAAALQYSQYISDVDIFVENASKLTQNATPHTYENIYISVRFHLSLTFPFRTGAVITGPYFKAFNLTPELYSQPATAQEIQNRGQTLFAELFPDEFPTGQLIEASNVVMLNYSANSMDGPWFAYNHNGCGFLVKPDAIALPSDTQLTALSEIPGLPNRGITAAVQVFDDGDVYYFLDDKTYITVTADGSTTSDPAPINSRWGIDATSTMQTSGTVDAAFVVSGSSYLTLDHQIYEYDGASFSTLVKEPYALSQLIEGIPSSWTEIDAAFTDANGVSFWFNNASGTVLRSDTGQITSIRTQFGLASDDTRIGDNITAAAVVDGVLHVINDRDYTVYNADGSRDRQTNRKVKTVLAQIFGETVENVSAQGHLLTAMMVIDGGVWTVSSSNRRHYVKDGSVQETVPRPFDSSSHDQNWRAGLSYTDTNGTVHHLAFYKEYRQISNGDQSLARAWSNYASVDFGNHTALEGVLNTRENPLGIFNNVANAINAGVYDAIYGFDVSTLYNTKVAVTGAFTTADGRHLIIITDTNTYHLFDNSQSPTEILTELTAGTRSGEVADLSLSVCLSTATVSTIWQDNQVDAAFIGTGPLGTANALYLFHGEEYLRFSPDENGEFPSTADSGYPKTLATQGGTEGFPQWSQIDAAFTSPDADANGQYVSYLFNNSAQEFYRSDTGATSTTVDVWGMVSQTNLQATQRVDAAYVAGGYLYLIWGTEYYRYTLESSAGNAVLDTIPHYIDKGYPNDYKNAVGNIDAAFVLNQHVYLFAGANYHRLNQGVYESTHLETAVPITGSWGNIPVDIRTSGLDAAFKHVNGNTETLYLIQRQNDTLYAIDYTLSNPEAAHPYEIKDVMYEVIRLTSSTAEQLNQLLFAGGIDQLLQMSTQEINESPTISFTDSTPENIKMNQAKFRVAPTNSHLDFNSANGIYYWEVFFHAPFLIAQTLNTDQQFEYAKQWYEYIFDPTETSDYWKFLPFLAADPDALMTTLGHDLDAFESLTTRATVATARQALTNLAAVLAPYQNIFLGKTNITLYEANLASADKLANIAQWSTFTALNTAINNLNATAGKTASHDALLGGWKGEMQEVLAIIQQLDYRIDLMRNYKAQLAVYLSDPFDPHAIAALRTIAYRKAIVMRYIDNLLDWGDMLFRQYTRETINEARMLYLLAYDLLGEKPQNMGRVVLEPTQTYNDFAHFTSLTTEDYDFLIDLENTTTNGLVNYEQSLSFAATQFDTITNPYFFIQENELFTEYWTRVEDRLGKIRNCLNIEGVAQPLPLFQPPIDPMALVNAVAGGGGIAAAVAMAGGAARVPDYRFEVLMGQARELIGKLKNFSDNLLSTLEKKDSEALSLLQSKQEAIMLNLVTFLKEAQITEAEDSLLNLEETKRRAQEQESHYNKLLTAGYLPEEATQLGMMTAAAVLHGVVALGRIVSGLSYVVPQFTAGPFSFGVTSGGKNVGDMMTQFGEAVQSGAEALSMGGEVAGVAAQFKRSKEDWELQKKMAASEIKQLDYQINSQKIRIKMAQQELLMHQKDIEHDEAIAQFMKDKFSNLELYNWMSGKLSSLFFQTYKMAHDYAKQAEQAFIFEKGIQAGSVNYITGMYWDSQRQGLLAGASLELDLDRMEKAYGEMDSRRLEITKNISLLETDPLALLALKTQGVCTIRLTEALFDYDFPGHYNRQIKTVSVAFDIGEGQSVNATLTQLSNKLVMATDIKAVKHLMDPTNEPTVNVRADWRAHQQVALSHVDQYTENSGLFELNFGDERYLPFEGTGAISHWRLELNGKKGAYNPADLLDVTIKLRYTAKQGGSRFANEVKGILRPYNATSFFDVAYNFPDEWTALIDGDSNEVPITLTRAMFPNMNSSKIIGLFVRYQYTDDRGGAIFTLNNELQVPNNTYLQPSTLSIGTDGSTWTVALQGDRRTLQNAEMVLVYKAQV